MHPDPSRPADAAWRITGGSPGAEELAALTVALSVLAARSAEVPEEEPRESAPWTPPAARRRTATAWAAAPQPGWRAAP